MNRRRFLQSSTLLGTTVIPATSRAATKGKIIIVGAGIAGLAAGVKLKAAGYDVLILEGRDRIGGRIHTGKIGTASVDLGAQWIEGIAGNPIYKLCQAYKIRTVLSNRNLVRTFDINGDEYDDNYDSLELAAQLILDKTETINDVRLQANLPDIDVETALEASQKALNMTLNAPQQAFVDWSNRWEVGSDEAEDLDKLSLDMLWNENDHSASYGDTDHIIPLGYGQLITRLAAGLNIRKSTVVKEIQYSPKGVIVRTADEDLTADRVIVTLPLGVLKAGSVKFTPGLPARKSQAINNLGFGIAHKVVLRFASKFWPASHFFGYTGGVLPEFIEWTNMAIPTGAPMLALWSHGSAARNLENLTPNEQVASAMAVVRKIFPKAPAKPTSFLVTNWGSDPFSRGAYSHMGIGSSSADMDALAAPVGDRLFFAGEATNSDHPATVPGAYLSGLREADRIIGL